MTINDINCFYTVYSRYNHQLCNPFALFALAILM